MIRQTSMARAPKTYPALSAGLKDRIRTARLQAALFVNRELILLYWTIGRDILSCQDAEERGVKLIERMATDLRRTFPEMTAVSARNLGYMRAFARAWPEEQVVQQIAAQLPWGHHIELLNAVKSPDECEWYARQAIQSGWSRAVLAHQIESGLYVRRQKGTGKKGWR
jgi:predicted nuclease of restriction endonuclease-like (RecB) superfamily